MSVNDKCCGEIWSKGIGGEWQGHTNAVLGGETRIHTQAVTEILNHLTVLSSPLPQSTIRILEGCWDE